jgi:hypothetical protein
LDPQELLSKIAEAQHEVFREHLVQEKVKSVTPWKFILGFAIFGLAMGTIVVSLASKMEKKMAGLGADVAWPLRSGWSLRGNFAGPVGIGPEASFVAVYQDHGSDDSPVYLMSFRLPNLEENWRVPVVSTKDDWYQSTWVEIIDGEIYLLSSDATLRWIGRETGRLVSTQQLSDVATNLCGHSEGIVLALKDEQHQLWDPDTWTFSPTVLDPSCEKDRSVEERVGEADSAPRSSGAVLFSGP